MTEVQENQFTKEVEEEEPIALTEEEVEFNKKREKAQRVKCICLFEMGKSPIQNVSALSHKEKLELLGKVKEMFENEDENIIIEKFNKICSDTIFGGDYGDYLNAAIYTRPITKLEHPITDIAGNIIEVDKKE